MFRNLPPLHALAAFEVVARLHSFAKAAEELCITQSAVSHRIKLLEEHFATQLFLRGGRNLVLTAHGEYFLSAVLDSLSILQAASNRMSKGGPRVVRVSVATGFANYWLIQRLGSFYRTFRDIELQIFTAKMTNLPKLTDLRSGEVDVAIRYGRQEELPGFRCIKLLGCELFPVCSPSYRESLGRLEQPEEMLRATLLRFPREPWSPWFRVAGVVCEEPLHGPLFNDSGLLINAALSGQGIALARSMLVSHELVAGRLVKLFDVSIPAESSYFAVGLPSRLARTEVRCFIEWLLAAATPVKETYQ